MAVENHINPDPAARTAGNARFVKAIELAGKMKVPYVGTMSGKIEGKKLEEQVAEIVKVYTEKYFPVCQKHNVKICWEPWAGGPNIATGPVGYEALFKAFDNSPYVGLLFDPSHLQWQMMDPVQAARDFVDKIWDVHLKDTEILWHVVRKTGINPLNNARWWRFRLPGSGIVDWRGFFAVLAEAGYQGAMNIEHEDEFYYPAYDGPNFTEQFKQGFRIAHQYLKQYVPA
jgi:sugar phosphate isomerase/epimerase